MVFTSKSRCPRRCPASSSTPRRECHCCPLTGGTCDTFNNFAFVGVGYNAYNALKGRHWSVVSKGRKAPLVFPMFGVVPMVSFHPMTSHSNVNLSTHCLKQCVKYQLRKHYLKFTSGRSSFPPLYRELTRKQLPTFE